MSRTTTFCGICSVVSERLESGCGKEKSGCHFPGKEKSPPPLPLPSGSAVTYALGSLLVDGLLAGAVAVGAELGVLDEAALLDEGLELLGGHKEVVDAVLLAGARLARRVRHGQREGVGVRREEPVVERALAHARRARDDQRATVGGCLSWGFDARGASC